MMTQQYPFSNNDKRLIFSSNYKLTDVKLTDFPIKFSHISHEDN